MVTTTTEMASEVIDESKIRDMWEEKISLGYRCINDLIGMMEIPGVEKLARDIQKDIEYLDKMTAIDILQVKSSNINRFHSLVRYLKQQSGVHAVLQPYKIRLNGEVLKSVVVDIVCHQDLEEIWIKVVAKNRQTLTSATLGDCSFGRRNIVDQGRDFVELSLQNKFNYNVPKIVFHFDSGIDSCVADAITELGIIVSGKVEFSDDDILNEDADCCENEPNNPCDLAVKNLLMKEKKVVHKLNLDVSAMIGYVSELTNGGSNLVCDNKVLNQQAKAEQVSPLLPVLNGLFEGRQLICCKVALEAFQSIVQTLGGPKEKKRSVELLKRLTIVSDSDRPIKLKPNKKITKRSTVIFMTGEDNKAITVTANNGLAQAAIGQGLRFAVFIHEARSLTEAKTPLNI